MKVVITIENNKVVVQTDDGTASATQLVEPVIESGTVIVAKTEHVPDDKDPFKTIARAPEGQRKYNRRGRPGGVKCQERTKVCEWDGCENVFSYTTPTRKFCDEHRGMKRLLETSGEPESSTKPCVKCQGDMPKHSMYDECAACRGVKPKKCGYCERKGRPCKRHKNKPEEPVAAEAKPKAVDWCRVCQAYTTHKSDEHPKEKPEGNFMPGYEKTPEEIEKIRAEAAPAAGKFEDIWDCQLCRDGQALCKYHLRMDKGGLKPKKITGRAPDSGSRI